MSNVILETRNLTKEFKGFTAVSEVNLKVERGHIHALIGPNGAGKTTCFNLLTKFLVPTGGQILFNGKDITAAKPAQIARMGVIRSFQISAVFPHLSVLQNVRLGWQRQLGTSFHFWQSERSLNRLNDRAMALLAEVEHAAIGQAGGRRGRATAYFATGGDHQAGVNLPGDGRVGVSSHQQQHAQQRRRPSSTCHCSHPRSIRTPT